MVRLFIAALAVAFCLPAVAAENLASHRALYRLTLDPQRGQGLAAAEGTMAFEVLDACEGWAVRQRLMLKMTARDGQETEMVSEYATFESKDGQTLRFRLRQSSQGAVSLEVAGQATLGRDGAPGEARYTLPAEDIRPLPPGTLFPQAHTLAAIAAARRGDRIMALPLFDGTSPDGAQESTTTIISAAPARPVERFPALSPLASWRMSVAFFEAGAAATGAPDYEVALRYWENGVADELKMDFGDFAVDGKMVEFELIPGGC